MDIMPDIGHFIMLKFLKYCYISFPLKYISSLQGDLLNSQMLHRVNFYVVEYYRVSVWNPLLAKGGLRYRSDEGKATEL